MSAIVIIPARYGSTRFPGKPLFLIKSKADGRPPRPLIQHVYENSKGSKLATDVLVATDSKEIYEAVIAFGGKAVMTSPKHASGTDRIAEAAMGPGYDMYDIIVNVQGDEPLIRPGMIDDVIGLLDDERASIGSLVKKISRPGDILDPNIVKAVFDGEGFALYFSRAPIPYHRDAWKRPELEEIRNSSHAVYKHIGIYGYRKDALLLLQKLPPSRLEGIERLEQLRALEHGMKIKLKETEFDTIGVDTPEDIERVEKCLSTYS